MPSLRIEDHVFRVAENQLKLIDFLHSKSRRWNWESDFDSQTVSFLDSRTGKALAICPVQFIGSQNDVDHTWLWGWANKAFKGSAALTADVVRMRDEAVSLGLQHFANKKSYPVTHGRFGMEMAVVVTGYLGHFTYYATDNGAGTAYFSIPALPEAAAFPADAGRKSMVITMGIAALEFDHRRAALAYLGEPSHVDGPTVTFPVGGDELHLTFAADNRIHLMESSVRGTTTAVPTTLGRRRNLLLRLFGRKG